LGKYSIKEQYLLVLMQKEKLLGIEILISLNSVMMILLLQKAQLQLREEEKATPQQ